MYDDPISARYIYLHPDSQNLIQEDNSHITSIFYFYFLDQPKNLNHQDEYSSHEKIVRAHKRWSLFHFLSLFLFEFRYRSAKYLAYENCVPNFLSGRIYSKLFLFAFYHPTTFIFHGSFHYSHRDGIFFLVLFHDHDSSFNRIHTLFLFKKDRFDGLVSWVSFLFNSHGGFTSTPTIWWILSFKDLIIQRSSRSFSWYNSSYKPSLKWCKLSWLYLFLIRYSFNLSMISQSSFSLRCIFAPTVQVI